MNNLKKLIKKIQNYKTYIIRTKKKLLTFLFEKYYVDFDSNNKIIHIFFKKKEKKKKKKEKSYSK